MTSGWVPQRFSRGGVDHPRWPKPAARRWAVWTHIICLVILAGGCRKNEPEFEVITLEGKVEKIEIKPDGTGTITLRYYSDKHNQEMVGTGTVTKTTEIMINGAVAELKDIRQGEQVRGDVRIEKRSGRSERIALKIYVNRAEPAATTPG